MRDARRPPGPARARSRRKELPQAGPTHAEPLNGGVKLSAEALQFLGSVAGISVWTWCTRDDRVYHAGLDQPDAVDQGLPLVELVRQIHRNDRRRVLRRMRAAAAQHGSGTLRFRSPEVAGQSRHFSATLFPQIGNHDGDHIQIIVQDVTRAALTEQALRRSEEHYQNSIALNPEVPWLADPEGRITEVGPRWRDLVGLTVEQTVGDGWTAALHPDDLASIAPVWQHSIRTGEPVDVEYRIKTVSGEYRWMRARASALRNPRGEVIRWYGTLEDVHERRLAVAALHESEAFARSILESSSIAIEVLDDEGKLIFINGPGIRIMEVADYTTTLGVAFEAVWPVESRPSIRDGIARALAGETTRRTLYGPTAAGTPCWWEISLSPIRGEDGRVARVLALSRDVTEARRNEQEVVSLARRLSNVLESTMDCVITVDTAWRITFANHRASAFFGADLLQPGRNLKDVFNTLASRSFFTRFLQALSDQCNIAFEEFLPGPDAWLEVQAYGSALGLTIFFRDVTERRRAQEQIVHLARHDALTGLANRVQFSERLEQMLAELAPGAFLAVLSIDLDDFKLVNDTLGHPAGDAVLREVAARLLAICDPNCLVARLGGDEFALIVPVARPELTASQARKILQTVNTPLTIEGEPVHIGASIGIAIAPRDGRNGETLLQNADVALYRVKASQGRGYRFYEPQMDNAIRERREMKRDLSLALERGELSLVYQPQIEIASNRLTGFEALLRWNHPLRGQVPPSDFIPIAEENGLIEQIGAFVLTTACREAMHWPESISVAINLSSMQFRRNSVREAVQQALSDSGLSPSRLELEITESVLLDDNGGTLSVLGDLHSQGIRVALDDFGTGYSSLSYLQRFPFDKLKIDRSFVSDLPLGEGSAAIVRAIIGLGRSLRIRVTAEGVETWEHLLFLRDEGCTEAQGYLFSQPLPAAQARTLALTREFPTASEQARALGSGRQSG
jgi:diguanylate cyclase (GGDEF)-like protein/PAS domain S-box-containing protein